jgi:hypothetical protein
MKSTYKNRYEMTFDSPLRGASKYSTMVSASAFQVDDPSSNLGTYNVSVQ